MAEKQKKHDLRDDIYAPRTTVTNTDERLAGAEPSTVDPEHGDMDLLRPGIGGKTLDGQATKSS